MMFYRPVATVVISLVVCVSAFAQKIVFQAKVTAVWDGATAVVETQSQTKFVVKCQATTAPQHGESYGESSRQRLSQLVLSKTVTVEYTERNDYGHILGTIYLNGEDVCLDQIRAGLASFDSKVPSNFSTSRRELYVNSEEYARNIGAGLWTTPAKSAANSIGQNTSGQELQATVNQFAVSSVLAPGASTSDAVVDVRGYFRKDGTYVDPYKRTAPDDRSDNNWSTVGNVNPHTGKAGTKSWFARNWWIFPTVGVLAGTAFLLRTSAGGGIPCKDGTVSQAQNRQGACSHHGGIR